MRARPLSVYVHLPFCTRKCTYCDFNSRPASPETRACYLEALHTELDRRAETLGGFFVQTIFFGGGTPTIYKAEQLVSLLDAIAARFEVDPDAEISCEANPETVDALKLQALRDGGFNRLSLGAQSFDNRELKLLGRGHTSEDIVRAARAARGAGFENLSLDLIYALPGQTLAGWTQTLRQALSLRPEHLSAYGLELAEGTPLAAAAEAGEITPVAEEEHLAMRETTGRLCAEAGLLRYEISNYARPGFQCRHNITYWRNDPYVGLGAGAWSYLEGVRSTNRSEPEDYIAAVTAGGGVREYSEQLDPDDALAEALMMGLRMTDGVRLDVLRERYGPERVAEVLASARPLAEMGLLEINERIRLTDAGEPLHGEICVHLA